jgi:hypothetical protein
MIVASSNATKWIKDTSSPVRPPDPRIALSGDVNTLETVRKRVQRARQSVDPIRLFLQTNGLYKL